MKIPNALWACLLWGVMVCFVRPAIAAQEITDDQGAVVGFERVPQRIVSLLPSLAEMVCELGHCQRLVGVDRYTHWPASLKALPRLGGGLDPNIEQIVALRPDAVLIASSSRAGSRLRALGLKVLAFEPKTHADVERVMLKMGDLLGVAHAPRMWRDIEAAVAAAAQALPANASGLRVYFEVDPGPYAASEGSFIGQTLARLGAKNIVPGDLGLFPKLNPEFVVRADPDLIMVGRHSADGMKQRPGWASMRAIRGAHVCVFSTEEADTLVRAGPRLAEGARLMADCLAKHSPAANKTQKL